MRRRLLALWYWILDIPLLRVLAWAWPLAGLCLVGYGSWLVYRPAGFIAVGVLILLDSLHASFISRAPK